MENCQDGKDDKLQNQRAGSTQKQWYVIGLSGVSSGGKTTLAMKILENIPTSIIYISQDEYILPNDFLGHLKAPSPLIGLNKDSLKSIDMVSMIKDIKHVLTSDLSSLTVDESPIPTDRKKVIGSALTSQRPAFYGYKKLSNFPSVLLLDGFLLFNHSDVPPLCNIKYFITLTKEQCWERRKLKIFTSPGMGTEAYFERCMWAKYYEHLMEMKRNVEDINYIKGIESPDSIYRKVIDDIIKDLESMVKS